MVHNANVNSATCLEVATKKVVEKVDSCVVALDIGA